MQVASRKARVRAIDEELARSPQVDQAILDIFAELQGHIPAVPGRGMATRHEVVDLDEPVRSRVLFLSLQQVAQAETGNEKCPHKIKDCYMERSCNYKDCLRLSLIGRES